MVVARGIGSGGNGKMVVRGYKLSASGDLIYSMVPIVNNTVLYTCNLLVE